MFQPELNCCWTFDRHSGREEGPNDALGQNFRQRPYASLVRESIQNSLDVPLHKGIPVTVSFSFGEIRSKDFSNFFKLKEHIEGCEKYFSDNKKAVAKYKAMLTFFDKTYDNCMPYIKVSDYNTKGMMYAKDNNNLPFYAFVRAASISVKNDGATGGTYGFGKAAYFQISPINTLLVSTQTDNGHVFFEGASVLCTHKIDGKKLTSVGFYDNNGGEPISDPEKIPTKFRRDEPGTDFYILGFDKKETEDAVDEMIEEILRSYSIAILKKHLIVKIEDINNKIITIDDSSVDKLLALKFPETVDKSSQSRSINPRPYFEAVYHSLQSDKYPTITKEYNHLGELKMYIKKDNDAIDKVMYMRRPLMYVFSKKTQSNIGFYGTLVCSDIKGDKILSLLENSSHSEWKKENYRDEITNKIKQEGFEALKELNDFVQHCVDKLSGTDNSTSMSMTDLDDYLYVPDSLIDDDEDKEKSLGHPSGEFNEESGSITTNIPPISTQTVYQNHNQLGTIVSTEPGAFIPNPNGLDTSGTSHPNNKKPMTKGSIPAPGTNRQKGEIIESNGKHTLFLNFPIRIAAQQSINGYVHHIIIHSDRDIESGFIELTVCGEQKDETIDIIKTSKGKITGNIISELSLKKGPNRFFVIFKDKMRHAIKTKLYYED